MANPENVFDEVIESAFGAKRFTGDNASINQLKEHAILNDSKVRKTGILIPDAPALYISVADRSSFNAFATWRDDIDILGLNSGVTEVLRDITNNILSHPQTFSEVGDTSAETAPALRRSLYPDTSYMGALVDPPIDLERRLMANIIELLIGHFLVFHEMGHVYRGHTRFDKTSTTSTFISEAMSSNKLRPDQVLTGQALEMDADSFAVAQMLINLFGIAQTMVEHAKSHGLPSIATVLSDKNYVLDVWNYAVYLFCTLVRELEQNPDALKRKRFALEGLAADVHPPARVRQKWIVQTLLPWCQSEDFSIDPQAGFESAKRAAQRVENDLSAITGKPVDLSEQQLAIDPKVDDHLDRVKARFEEIADRLKAVSYMASDQLKK